MDKTALIKRIQEIDGLSNEERSALLGLLRSHKKYGLVWEDKPEDVEERLRDELPVLREVKDKYIPSDAEDAPNHIIIEGDNLEALTALSYTHEGKVDVIYIDPPYNTGNKDFVYNDAYIDSEDSYRHSKWLSFMNKRLKIAKMLLSERGVIFISIDDNEQANLKLLCDSIFGEDNGIGPFIQNKQNAKNDTANIQKNHEFVLCYRKKVRYVNEQSSNVIPNIVVANIQTKEVIKEGDRFYYLNDSITTRGEGGTLNARPNLGYSFYYNPLTGDLLPVADYDIELARTSNDENLVYKDNSNLVMEGYVAIRPPLVRGQLGCWTWDINKAKNDIDLLIVKKTRNRYNIIKRTFVSPTMVFEDDGKFYYKEEVYSNSKSILDFSTNEGTNAFKEILGNEVAFNNPKNVSMLKYFVSISSLKDSTILDFFAGSGTTLHSTMQLNDEDGGKRKCILVTNNENGICENVTYERNRRVIQGYINPRGEEISGLTNNSLRYYRTDFVGRDRTQQNMRDLVTASTDLLCIKEDLYNEQNKFGRFRVNPRLMRYFSDGKKHMLVVYREEIVGQLAAEIANLDFGKEKLKIYIFSPARYAFNDNFAEVSEKVTLVALPAAIYDAYEKVLPKRKEKLFELEEEKEVVVETSQDLFSGQEEGGEQ